MLLKTPSCLLIFSRASGGGSEYILESIWEVFGNVFWMYLVGIWECFLGSPSISPKNAINLQISLLLVLEESSSIYNDRRKWQ